MLAIPGARARKGPDELPEMAGSVPRGIGAPRTEGRPPHPQRFLKGLERPRESPGRMEAEAKRRESGRFVVQIRPVPFIRCCPPRRSLDLPARLPRRILQHHATIL